MQDLGGPPVVASVEGALSFGHDLAGADEVDVRLAESAGVCGCSETGSPSHIRARRNDRHLARGHVFDVHDAFDTAVMVDVGMGVDHRHYRLVADMLTEQVQALLGAFNPGHAVDDHQAIVTLDDGQVGDVVVADLV